MTKAPANILRRKFGKEKILMFSRASYVGAHRSSGIWFGDNHSWWSHILLDLKMLPSANMCGFLYCGADLGGFNENATRDLVLRFLALGVFTPLMRNLPLSAQEIRSATALKTAMISRILLRFVTDLFRTFTEHSKRQAKRMI